MVRKSQSAGSISRGMYRAVGTRKCWDHWRGMKVGFVLSVCRSHRNPSVCSPELLCSVLTVDQVCFLMD